MAKLHMKRISAPRTWPILRKQNKFIQRPDAGTHLLRNGMPLGTWLTEVIGATSNSREAARALKQGNIQVNGKLALRSSYTVGLFDTITIVPESRNYIILLNDRNTLRAVETSKFDGTKISRVKGKRLIKGGKKQYTTFEGYNILDNSDYSVGDTIVLNVAEKKIVKTLPMKEGAHVYVTRGHSVGKTAQLKNIEGTTEVTLELEGIEITTLKKAVVVVDGYKQVQDAIKKMYEKDEAKE